MNQFKKLAKAFTTWKSSPKSSSESKPKLSEHLTDYFDAEQRVREYMNYAQQAKGLMASPQSGLSNASNMVGQAAIAGHHTWTTANTNPAMTIDSSGNWGIGAQPSRPTKNQTVSMTVEKVDNGFILRSTTVLGDPPKVKICATMDELKDLFVSTMVEHQLEK